MIKKRNIKFRNSLIWHILFGSGISIILFHLLRNVSSAYFGLILLVLSGFLLVSLKETIPKKSVLIGGFFIVVIFYVLVVSLLATQDDNPSIGFVRLFYLFPVVSYFFNKQFNDKESLFFWKIILIFSILATLSILIQYIIGPISWFAVHSGRASTDRFASLIGSLTAYGGFVAVPLLISMLMIKNRLLKFFIIILLIFGAALSLQKMSIASVLISFLLVAHFEKKRLSFKLIKKIFCFLLLLIVLAFTIYYFLSIYFPHHLLYFSLIFSADAGSVGDVSVNQSVANRFIEFPLAALKYWGFSAVFIGVGVYGGSGGLGYPYFPMAHNLLFEIILIFGIPLGATLLYLFFSLLARSLRLAKKYKNTRFILALSVFSALLLTNLFSGGLLYHPVIGLSFWFSVSEVMRFENYVFIQQYNTTHHRRHRLLRQRSPRSLS